jgi:hypothetical protein
MPSELPQKYVLSSEERPAEKCQRTIGRLVHPILPGLANFLVARLALEGIINWSRNWRRGSAASSDAAYSCDAASSEKMGFGAFVPVILVVMWSSMK